MGVGSVADTLGGMTNSTMLTLVMTAFVVHVAAARAEDRGTFTDLGVQITSSTMQGAAFATDASGRHLLFTAMRGEPAKLLMFDVASGDLLKVMPLKGAQGAWSVTTASDGSIYVGGQSNGHLYRYVPGEEDLVSLGQCLPGQTFVWDLTAGQDGEVFGATYPGCRAFRYHPDGGFSDVGSGPLIDGELYARSIDYDETNGKIYVGVGTKAHLIELDPKTGDKRNLLPNRFDDKKFVYAVAAEAGRIFGQLADGNEFLVLNRDSGEIEALLPSIHSRLVSPKSPYADVVYFSTDGKLHAYDLSTRQASVVDVNPTGGPQTLTWLRLDGFGADGPALVGFVRGGSIFKYHPATGESSITRLSPPGEPTPIQHIHRGPGGRIYSGGYLSGGLSVFDPAENKTTQLGSISQSEGMATMGDNLYLGVYPGARLYVYDATRPFQPRENNPRLIGQLDEHDQDRPFGMLGVESLGKVFIGTVSDYGRLGGAMSIYDVKTQKLDVHRNIVPQQSVVSLAHHEGLVYAGTTISGGLGIKPTAGEAVLFIWDPAAEKKVFETVPVPDAMAVTSLLVTPDGLIWGMAQSTLFVFDPRSREVIERNRLFDITYNRDGHVWHDATLGWHPSGVVYGTQRGRFFRIDPRTKSVTVLREGGCNHLAIDDLGNVYFTLGSHLWQYTPEVRE